MKKKPENRSLAEPCYRMSHSKLGINENEVKLEDDFVGDGASPNTPSKADIVKIKSEDGSINNNDVDSSDHVNSDNCSSPASASLGPGAEIKGKLCHPVTNACKVELDNSGSPDSGSSPPPPGTCGGRLTFFKEGRPLLELSHRSDQRSWFQVKSKTYWPPPSLTTATSTQHPLRHDTPTTHSASDDCSSLNSSPWSNDHIRKQITPRTGVSISSDVLFCFRVSSLSRNIRKKIRLRRNQYRLIIGPSICNDKLNELKLSKVLRKVIKANLHTNKLDSKIRELWVKFGCKLGKVTIHSLFEKSLNNHAEVTDPTFLSPRKRYLRTLETDNDNSHIRKKAHANLNASHVKSCDRPSSSSSPTLHPYKSAISSHSSSYSIDSLLMNNENDSKKSNSYLRTLLKHDSKSRNSSHPKNRERNDFREHNSDKVKVEKEGNSLHSRERMDQRKVFPDSFEMNHDLPRYTPSPGLGNIYYPYFDPRYMMLQNLSANSHLLPSSSQANEVSSAAVAVAAAAAAAAAAASSYPLNPLHLSALTASSLIPPGLHSPYVSSVPPIASHLLRSPTSNGSSPVSLSHSPISKQTVASSPTPLSPHLRIYGSPIDNSWNALVNSPHKIPREPPDSPPPQDVPLNLSKSKDKS